MNMNIAMCSKVEDNIPVAFWDDDVRKMIIDFMNDMDEPPYKEDKRTKIICTTDKSLSCDLDVDFIKKCVKLLLNSITTLLKDDHSIDNLKPDHLSDLHNLLRILGHILYDKERQDRIYYENKAHEEASKTLIESTIKKRKKDK